MKFTLHLHLVFFSIISFAQTPLPYYTGFDNAGEKAGWTDFRIGFNSFSDWSYATFGAVSPPTMLTHDYPVGSGSTDTTEDWWVSPPFNFSGGGSIDSFDYYIYSITGATTPADFLGFYLLEGSQDPDIATRTQLCDLTTTASTSVVWRDTGNFVIPSAGANSYIGIRYRATNNWFVANIDNIHINGSGVGIPVINDPDIMGIYPNPANEKVYLSLHGLSVSNISVFNSLGEEIENHVLNNAMTDEFSINTAQFEDGIYFIRIETTGQIISEKLIIRH